MADTVVFQLPDGRVVDGPPDQLAVLQKQFPGARTMPAEEVAALDATAAASAKAGGLQGAAEEFGARALQSLTPFGLMTPAQNLEQLAATGVPVAKALAARVTGDVSEESRQQGIAAKALEEVQRYQSARAEKQKAAGFAGELAGTVAGFVGLRTAKAVEAAASAAVQAPAVAGALAANAGAAQLKTLVAKSLGFNGLQALAELGQTATASGEALSLGDHTLNLIAKGTNLVRRGSAIGAGIAAQELAREQSAQSINETMSGEYIASQIQHGALSGIAFEGLLGAGGRLVRAIGGEKVARVAGGAAAGAGAYAAAEFLGAAEPVSALAGAGAAYMGGKTAANAVRAFGESQRIGALKNQLDESLRGGTVGVERAPGSIPTPEDIAASKVAPQARAQQMAELMEQWRKLGESEPTTAQEFAEVEANRDALQRQITLIQVEEDAATAAREHFDEAYTRKALDALNDPKNPGRHIVAEQAETLEAEAQKDTRAATRAVTATLKGQETTQTVAYGQSKRAQFRLLSEADGVPFDAAQSVAADKLAQVEADIAKIHADPNLSDELRAVWKHQAATLKTAFNRVASLSGEEATAGDVMSVIDDWKRAAQADVAKVVRGKGLMGADAQAFNSFRALVDDDVRVWLENTPQFGERATMLQRDLNLATTAAITNRAKLAQALATTFDRNTYDAYKPGFEADSAKVFAVLSRMTGEENASLRKLIETQNARELQLANVIRRGIKLSPADAARIDQQIAAHEELSAIFSRSAKRSIAKQALDAASQNGISDMVRKAAGDVGMIASGVKAIAAMQSNVMRERAVARMVAHIHDKIERAGEHLVTRSAAEGGKVAGAEFARIATGKEKAAPRTGGVRPTIAGAAKSARNAAQKTIGSVVEAKGTTQITAAAKQAATVIALSQSPALLQKAIMGSVGAHYDADNPTLYDATAVAAAKGFAYLERTMPPGLRGLANGVPQTTPQVSDAELAAWNRRLQAVQSPLSVLDDIKAGTVTSDQAEALRIVHPAIYGAIHDKLIRVVADSKTPVPYAQRVMFFTLFDAPVDRTLGPDVIKMLQQNFTAHNAAGAAPRGKVPEFTANMRTGASTIGNRK